MRPFVRLFLWFVCGAPLVVSAEWYQLDGVAMGTEVSVQLWSDSEQIANDAMRSVLAEMQRVDKRFSPYIANSELSKLNKLAYAGPVKVSTEMFQLLASAESVARLSDGAFDITFSAVGHLYDYRQARQPSASELNGAISAVSYQHVVLNAGDSTVRFSHPGTRVDLGGIAKGHAVDRGIHLLKTFGIRQALVSAGGDSRLLGDRRGQPWVTGIKDPRGRESLLMLPLDNVAISTSGDYERYFIDSETGERHHHILSPKTGKSVSELRSATVLAEDSTTADALSTTVFVLGIEKGLRLINNIPSVDAIIIDANGLLHYSSDLQRLEKSQR
ncbi:MAG: FAD:protein FMN transferase [Pseudomonadota bacterium]